MPPPTALAVSLVLSDYDPYIKLSFRDPRYRRSHGERHDLSLPSVNQLDSIRMESSDAFGIRFVHADRAKSWYEDLENPWRNLFSRKSGSQTVWVPRIMTSNELDRLPLPPPRIVKRGSWWNKLAGQGDDDDEGGKSRSTAGAAIVNVISKKVKKVQGRH
jgi:hypothetical protein